MTVSPSIDISRLSSLACYAHPDDEGFASGGLLAMLASAGARVTLVCATNGDVGEISDPILATPENLWQVRKQELRNAMDITGISDVRFLDYRDSGMDGTDDNRHPNAYCNAGADTVVDRLAEVIAEINPHVHPYPRPQRRLRASRPQDNVRPHHDCRRTRVRPRRRHAAALLRLLPTKRVPTLVAGNDRPRHRAPLRS